jgi:hypothetical protein
MKTTDEIVRIVNNGGSVIVDASKTTDDLVRIVNIAGKKGSKVIIRGAGKKTTDDIVRIAHVSEGCATFDLTDL